MAEISITYENLSFEELGEPDQELVKLAEQSMDLAHAPYSHFTVGSAVRMSDGHVFSGSNQENAAYPSGLCAERVALFKAKSESKAAIEAVAVVARNDKGMAADAFACGSCRQVMMEYASLQSNPIKILMQTNKGNFILVDDIKALLPFSFEVKTLH